MTTSTETEWIDPTPPLPEGWDFGGGAEPGGPNLDDAAAILDAANADGAETEVPLIAEVAPGDALLPGGIVRAGVVHRDAVIRELTGADEEYIARAVTSNNPGRFVQALLERGVESVGGLRADTNLLDSLLIGDRDMLVLEIRRTTYGRTLGLDMICQNCGVESEVEIDLDEDIRIKQMDLDPLAKFYSPKLPSGREVYVRLVNGADQQATFALQISKPDTTVTGVNSLLLSRVVMSYDGFPLDPKMALDAVLNMSAGDRRAIIDYIIKHQPGPDYNDVKHDCSVCGKEQSLGLSPMAMFPVY